MAVIDSSLQFFTCGECQETFQVVTDRAYQVDHLEGYALYNEHLLTHETLPPPGSHPTPLE